MNKIEYGTGIFTLTPFLSKEECFNFMQMSENIGYEEAEIITHEGSKKVKEVRNNDRVIFDDIDLAKVLFEKIKSFLPEVLEDWKLLGLNERFRFYRYTAGQYFKWHLDGSYQRNAAEVSELSFLMYLNDDYQGGETMFYQFAPDMIKPMQGMALLFPHLLLHQGAPVISGVKYVLRTDVMYYKKLN